ncbi:MAG: hypothetical protein ACM3XN_11095 [Chloroflexota bacterium]
MALVLWYVVPLLAAVAIGLWQWRIDIRFRGAFDDLTWDDKMAYLRARKWRTLIMVAIIATYLTVVRGGVFERLVGIP